MEHKVEIAYKTYPDKRQCFSTVFNLSITSCSDINSVKDLQATLLVSTNITIDVQSIYFVFNIVTYI